MRLYRMRHLSSPRRGLFITFMTAQRHHQVRPSFWTHEAYLTGEKSQLAIPSTTTLDYPLAYHRALYQSRLNSKFRLRATRGRTIVGGKRYARLSKLCWSASKKKALDFKTWELHGMQIPFEGWQATLAESLDALWIMDMKEDFAEAVEAALGIDCAPSSEEYVDVSNAIVRVVGSFLSAYDVSGCRDQRLLNKAMEVTDMVYAAFDTPNRMPISAWYAQKAVNGERQELAKSDQPNHTAAVSIELARLSQLTGDLRYFDATSRVTDDLEKKQSLTKLPGTWPYHVKIPMPHITLDKRFDIPSYTIAASFGLDGCSV